MKTAIALVLAATFATSTVQAQTVAAPVAPVVGVLPGTGLSGAGLAIGLGAAALVVGGAIALGSDDDDDSSTSTSGTGDDD